MQGKYLRDTIESVLSQRYPALEYLVMDGGSTDDTVAILRSYGSRVQWVSRKDRGQTDAINQGIARTHGEILGYLNSDDMLTPQSLWRVAYEFAAHPEVQWLTGDYHIVDEGSRGVRHTVMKSIPIWYKRWQRALAARLPWLWPWLLAVNNPIAQPATFWRRTLHSELGLLDDTLRYTMDYDWWWRLLRRHRPRVLADTLARFRVHAESLGGAQYAKQFAEECRVAKRYVRTHGWHVLHRAHARLIIALYSWGKPRSS